MDIVTRVEELKRAGRHEEAIPILKDWIASMEGNVGGVAPWPYEHLAIIYRKLRMLDEEERLLEHFAGQRHGLGAKPPKLLDRLQKVYEKRGLLERAEVDGQPVLWHREHDCRVDEVPVFLQRGLVVDTETTGLSHSDELIEFAGILFAFSRLSGRVTGELDRYGGLREPRTRISPAAARVHGITAADVAGRTLDRERVEGMIARADAIIAHNAPFDQRFVVGQFPLAADRTWHCSLRACSWKKRGYPSGKLDDILAAEGIVRAQGHRALDDAAGLLELLSRPSPALDGRTYLLEVTRSVPVTYMPDPPAFRGGGGRGRRVQVRAPEPPSERPSGCLSGVVLAALTMAAGVSAVLLGG